jgi:CO/xanthine dehydrogenase Mo-binding subunit
MEVRELLDMYEIIGKKVTRVDGYEKVTGKAVFGDDIKLPGMLHAANRYTDIPAGKITKIDIRNIKNKILYDYLN